MKRHIGNYVAIKKSIKQTRVSLIFKIQVATFCFGKQHYRLSILLDSHIWFKNMFDELRTSVYVSLHFFFPQNHKNRKPFSS